MASNVTRMPHSQLHYDHARIARLQRVAKLLDAEFSIFGFRFGIDAIIGLFPVLGDSLAGLLGLYIVWEARKLGVSNERLNRMLTRVAVDFLVGSIPVLGDIFDFFYKSNMLNLREVMKDFNAQ